MTETKDTLFGAIDATWPAAQYRDVGPWRLRDGQGGGKRVSAATLSAPFSNGDINLAEAAMIDMGQMPLFMVRNDENDLDAALAAAGYRTIDPTVAMTCATADLASVSVPRLVTFAIWEPLAIMSEIWAEGGIGPARLNVMHRAEQKTAIFARWGHRPAGTGFAAISDDIAMVHAVEVLKQQRRQGIAGWIMRAAAQWAEGKGARTISVLCTRANEPALNLYSGLGFTEAGHYHYRYKPEWEGETGG